MDASCKLQVAHVCDILLTIPGGTQRLPVHQLTGSMWFATRCGRSWKARMIGTVCQTVEQQGFIQASHPFHSPRPHTSLPPNTNVTREARRCLPSNTVYQTFAFGVALPELDIVESPDLAGSDTALANRDGTAVGTCMIALHMICPGC